jgi:hypothetical protein
MSRSFSFRGIHVPAYNQFIDTLNDGLILNAVRILKPLILIS